MNPLEIALIIIGIIIIIISCRLVDKTQNTAVTTAGRTFSPENLAEQDKIQLKNKMDEMLSDVSEEVIVRTDDTLSKISNEKIMAVNDFSDQILEKIKRNHEEVIFLYNMLNDKEKELKSAVKEIDSSKKKVQDILENKSKNDGLQVVKETQTQAASKPVTQAARIENTVKVVNNPTDMPQDISTLNSVGVNKNTKILNLYSKGKSVMEISKLLDMGQGEVKLVIDLFKGKK
ncbi:MAG: DUF6115 domain-containing protein [Herbinix sp.]|nr:DUF6115 domain-containing protein [Herbinix sp.]